MNNLENELHLLKKILDTLPSSIYFKDLDGRYVWLNQSSIHQLKVKHSLVESIIGKTDFDIFPEINAREYAKNDRAVIETKKGIVVEEEVFLSTGEKLIQLSFKEPLYNMDTSQLLGILGYTIDITEKKEAEAREKIALLESAESKTKAVAEEQLRQAVMVLTGSIVHDLRTPICMIEMDSRLLKNYLPSLLSGYNQAKRLNISIENDKNISDRVKNHLLTIGDGIKKTAREMHDFIDTTLKTLSKVVSGELTQNDLVRCSMWHCIHSVLHKYPLTNEQRALITWDQADFQFMGNELLMIRVFFNLIKNSLEQIEKNKCGKIFIQTEKKEDCSIVLFKDTAGGVSPEILENLFSGYQTTKKKGTGIGLAFCKMTMEEFGGEIRCDSVAGEYIQFTLSFPPVNSDKEINNDEGNE